MDTRLFLFLILGLNLLPPGSLPAQPPPPAPPPAVLGPEPPPRTAEFMAKFLAAAGRYRVRDFEGAVRLLEQAESILPQQADVSDLRGLIALRRRDFNEAEQWFKRGLRQNPNLWSARVHYADLPFTYKNYAVARSRYEALLAQVDSSGRARERELLQFKIFLTYLLEARLSTARSHAQRLTSTRRAPAQPCVDASFAFYRGDLARGRALLGRLARPPLDAVTAAWLGTFAQVGWIPYSPAWEPMPIASR